MSADLLRRAAALMRERAEGATSSSEWHYNLRDEQTVHIQYRVGMYAAAFCGTEANALHIASWHPAVALAVADWLDLMANKAAINIKPDLYILGFHSALAVARAYLGEDA